MSMRVQLSIMLTDTELYNGLVSPLKKQKELHGLVVRCLSAYYYSEQARNLIDGISPDESNSVSNEDVCNNIRNLLAMQSFLTQELEHVIEDGKDDVSTILDSVNRMAEDNGVVKSTQSEYGSATYRITAGSQDSESVSNTSTEVQENHGGLLKNDFLVMLLERVLRNQNDMEGIALMHNVLGDGVEVDSQAVSETVREIPKTEVTVTEPQPEKFYMDDVVERKESVKDVVVTPVTKVVAPEPVPVVKQAAVSQSIVAVEVEEEDASAALADLFGSI